MTKHEYTSYGIKRNLTFEDRLNLWSKYMKLPTQVWHGIYEPTTYTQGSEYATPEFSVKVMGKPSLWIRLKFLFTGRFS